MTHRSIFLLSILAATGATLGCGHDETALSSAEQKLEVHVRDGSSDDRVAQACDNILDRIEASTDHQSAHFQEQDTFYSVYCLPLEGEPTGWQRCYGENHGPFASFHRSPSCVGSALPYLECLGNPESTDCSHVELEGACDPRDYFGPEGTIPAPPDESGNSYSFYVDYGDEGGIGGSSGLVNSDGLVLEHFYGVHCEPPSESCAVSCTCTGVDGSEQVVSVASVHSDADLFSAWTLCGFPGGSSPE